VDNRAAQVIRRELERRKGLEPPQGQKELADELGMSQSFLSRLARGEKEPKLWADGAALERVLGIKLDDFNLPPLTDDAEEAVAGDPAA
jgi:ribosome-binding protein aMBF1 (putative translation factor)